MEKLHLSYERGYNGNRDMMSARKCERDGV